MTFTAAERAKDYFSKYTAWSEDREAARHATKHLLHPVDMHVQTVCIHTGP